MYFAAFSSLTLLAFSAKTASQVVAPPNGVTAMYSIFDHVGCDDYSMGMTIVNDEEVGECHNFRNASVSVKFDEVKVGCTSKLNSTFVRRPKDVRHKRRLVM